MAAAVATRYSDVFCQNLTETQQQSSTAVEKMLRMRISLADLPSEMRSLFLRKLARHYQR